MSNLLPALVIASAGGALSFYVARKVNEQGDAWNSRAESLPAGDPNKAEAKSRAGSLALVAIAAPLLISAGSCWAAYAIAKS